MRNILTVLFAFFFLLLCNSTPAISCIGPECEEEVLVYGSPYDPTSTTFNPITYGDWIGYYNPLKETTSGIYGVNAGITQDTGSGWGYADPTKDALQMYLEFDLPDTAPAYSGYLKFHFIDLDLVGANDPSGFYEDIQIHFSSDGGSTWDPATPIISSITDSGGNWAVGGSSYYQHITFNDILISQDPFLARLDFSTIYTGCGTNTKEWVKAELCASAVPLPAPIFLLGTGLIGLAGFRRKTKQ